MIPLFYKIVAKNCKKYKIPRIRLVNEDIFHTWKTQGVFAGIKNGGIIKYMVLKIMTLYLKQVTPVYFFSILFSCRITPECMRKIRIPKKWNAIEIMVHPGMPEVDKKICMVFLIKISYPQTGRGNWKQFLIKIV